MLPSIQGCNRKVKVTVNPNLLTNHEVYYSKALPQQRRQLQRIQDIENDLLDHPLALHSHYEESLPSPVRKYFSHYFSLKILFIV